MSEIILSVLNKLFPNSTSVLKIKQCKIFYLNMEKVQTKNSLLFLRSHIFNAKIKQYCK